MDKRLPTKEEFAQLSELFHFLSTHYEAFTSFYEEQKKEDLDKILHPAKYGPIGYVYIMRNCGYCKIGSSLRPEKRFGEYTKLPEEPEYLIVRKVKNYEAVEKALHAMFASKRNRDGGCEWFLLSEEEITQAKAFINSYRLDSKKKTDNTAKKRN